MSIEIRNISKRFGSFQALDDVSVDVETGSLTALLGPSGSGKSTLLRIIAGLEQPDTGVIGLGGEDATVLTPQKRGVGFVFQHYAAFKHMTVRENVAFGLKIRKRPADEVRKRVADLLALVQLEGFADRYPAQLSGGQRQRMALARALAPRAEGAAARRAVRRARRARARRAARLAAPAPRRDAHHDRLRHARPGRGDGGGRQRRRHEPRPDRAGRRPTRALRRARERVRDVVRRPGEPLRRLVGAPARLPADADPERHDPRGDGRARHPPRLRSASRAGPRRRRAVRCAADPRRSRAPRARTRPDRLHQADAARPRSRDRELRLRASPSSFG